MKFVIIRYYNEHNTGRCYLQTVNVKKIHFLDK